MPKTQVRSALEAANMVDLGIKGERRIMAGLLPLAFVEDILAAVKEEIRDDEVLHRIGVRLRRVAMRFSLPS